MSERSEHRAGAAGGRVAEGGDDGEARRQAVSPPAARAGPSAAASARRRLDAQRAVSAALGRSLTPAEVTRVVLDAAVDALGADVGSVALLAPGGEVLHVTEVAGGAGDGTRDGTRDGARDGARDVARPVVERSVALSAPEPVAALVRAVGPVFGVTPDGGLPNVPVPNATPPSGAGAVAGAPFVVAGRAFGALCLRFRDARAFDEDEQAFVLSVAQQFAEAAERARLYEAEHGARAQAEAANRAKTEFLTTMSHEIRTPVNAIVGYTELIEMGIAGAVSDAQLGFLQRIRASSRHLLAIINDLLDLSKVEAGRLLVTSAESSASQAADSALAIVHPQAAARSIALASRCLGAGDVCYFGDPRRVEQILLNLLSNALRFTDPGGRVTVTCRTVDTPGFQPTAPVVGRRWCAIDVEDTGVGIAPDHAATIFDPFVQVDTGYTRAHGGSGLGLAISRRLARAMDGDLTVTSALGRGSTFTLWVPAAESPGAPADAATAPAAARRRGAIGLTEVADAVLGEIDTIVKHYMARLRTDPQTPSAHVMKDTELEDHSAIFVSDLAQALAIHEEAEGVHSTLVSHDQDIQHLIAERHGELRHDLGWRESEMERDFEILWEEMERAVRRALPTNDPKVVEGLRLLRRFVDRAGETSRRAYRRREAERQTGA